MFITRHYPLASLLYPSIHRAFTTTSIPICTCAQSGMSVMLNDTGFTGLNGLPGELSLLDGHTW